MLTQDRIDQFALEEGQDIPQGLTAELLANLHDVVQKFGQIDQEDGLRRLSLDEPHEIHVSSRNDPVKKTMVIVGKDGLANEGTYVVRVLGTNPELIFWDMRVSVTSMEAFIKEIDSIAKEHGSIDPVTNERKQLEIIKEAEKWQVEVIFKEPGSTMPVFPGGLCAEDLINSFDHPLLLTVIKTPLGGEVIVRKDSLGYLQHREQVALAVLQEEGLDIHSASNLPAARILEIRERIKQRMTQ